MGTMFRSTELDVAALQVKKFPIYDLFFGEGWDSWSRYLLKKGKLIYLGGNKLTDKTVLSSLSALLTKPKS